MAHRDFEQEFNQKIQQTRDKIQKEENPRTKTLFEEKKHKSKKPLSKNKKKKYF